MRAAVLTQSRAAASSSVRPLITAGPACFLTACTSSRLLGADGSLVCPTIDRSGFSSGRVAVCSDMCLQRHSLVCAAAGHSAVSIPTQTERPPARLAVFVSGGGSNMKAIHAACLDGRINASIVVVVSDVPGCGGVTYAQQHGIPTLTYPIPKKGDHPGLTVPQLVEAMKEAHKVDYVLLAGYLKLIPADLVKAYPRAMLNIHPGLLPSFGGKGLYGERVHKAVLASGARFSGPTVHFVDEEFDTGPILAQRVVPVDPLESHKSLAAKVLKQEHQVYPEAVAALVDGRITWRQDGIPVMWTSQ